MAEYVISSSRYKAPDGRWVDEENPRLKAACLTETVRYIEYRQEAIHQGHRKHAQIYLGYVPSALAWTLAGGTSRPEVQATKNIVRSVCDTATALISKTMPKPSIVTDGGDWEVQQRAVDLDRFLVGAYSRANLYAVAQKCFHDSCVFGTGAWRLVERRRDGDFWIEAQRVQVDDLVVDEDECPEWPHPKCWYHRRLVPVEDAIREWASGESEEAEALATRIRLSAGKQPMHWPAGRNVPKDKCVVVEAWMPATEYEAGRYVACIGDVLLADEPWEFEWAPFVVLYWAPPVSGFYGDGVAYRQFGRQKRINYLYRWIQRCQDLIANPRVWVDATSGPLRVQLSNEIGEVVAVRGRKPEFQMPQAVSAEIYQWLDSLERGGFEDEGISQMSAANKLPPGIESAPAQREYSFKEGQRFAPVSQRWEDAVARESAYKMIALFKRAYDSGKRVVTSWADRRLAETIDWEDVDMDRDRYQIRVEASSLEALSPAGRLQAAIELAQTGWITPQEGRRLLGHPDLERSDQLGTAGFEEAEWVAAQLLRGEPVAIEAYSDFKLHQDVIKATLLRARMGRAPRRVMDNLRNYLRALDARLTPPPMGPMGLGAPGAPQPGAQPGAQGAGPTPALAPGAAEGFTPFAGPSQGL